MDRNECRKCAANAYSTDAAMYCTPCPVNKVSAVGSKSDADCRHGLYLVNKILKSQYLKHYETSNIFVI